MHSTKATFFLLLAMIMMLAVEAGWKSIYDNDNDGKALIRKLRTTPAGGSEDEEYFAFIHSVIDGENWCIAASDGVVDGSLVRLEPCDFVNSPSVQLWQLSRDGKFQSKLDDTKCMRVGPSIFLQESSRVRMANCDIGTDLNVFDHTTGSYDQIVVQEYNRFCLTNQGTRPRPGDIMIARACAETDRFAFFYFFPEEHNDDSTTTFGLCNDDAYPESGCLTVKDEDPKSGNSIILGNRNLNHYWRYDDYGLFHTALDDDMCLQAGHGGQPSHGTKMRLYPCDETNPLQQFYYDGVDIDLRGWDDLFLCVGFRGDNSHVDVDPLILKDCSKWGNNWSQD